MVKQVQDDCKENETLGGKKQKAKVIISDI
jgi:hypothetical protein